MFSKRIKKKLYRYRPRGKNLITSKRIKPEFWHISPEETKIALRAAGCNVKKIKKIRLLKYQVCISYWNEQGGVCSGFFSYRLFVTWQKKVEVLIANCPNLKEWQLLNHIMDREFNYFRYPTESSDALHSAMQNRLYTLKAAERQAVYSDISTGFEWEYF